MRSSLRLTNGVAYISLHNVEYTYGLWMEEIS